MNDGETMKYLHPERGRGRGGKSVWVLSFFWLNLMPDNSHSMILKAKQKIKQKAGRKGGKEKENKEGKGEY